MLRTPLAALILFLTLAPLPGSQLPHAAKSSSNRLLMRAMPNAPIGQRYGALTLVEAWELSSRHSGFGGLSGMTLMGHRHFLMVSDAGYRLEFALGAQGQISGAKISDLPPIRRDLTSKQYVDAESVAYDPSTRRYWIALEGIAQIWRFGADGKRQARSRNPIIFDWPANGGPEAMTRLPDGGFIALSERVTRHGQREGVLFSGDPGRHSTTYFRFAYDSAGLGSTTDTAALADGRLLILHRKLGVAPLFTSAIALADPRRLTRDATLKAMPIATIADPRLSENYEGMTLDQGPDGLSLWLLSDDNQNDWQRTRLLRFRIDPAALDSAKGAPSKKGGAVAGPP